MPPRLICHPAGCHTLHRWNKWEEKTSGDSETRNWIVANTKPCPKCNKARAHGGEGAREGSTCCRLTGRPTGLCTCVHPARPAHMHDVSVSVLTASVTPGGAAAVCCMPPTGVRQPATQPRVVFWGENPLIKSSCLGFGLYRCAHGCAAAATLLRWDATRIVKP